MGILKDNWVDRMVEVMMVTHPNVPSHKIREIVERTYDSRAKDTQVQIFNNYENQLADTSLVRMVDWYHKAKPLIAESGVYFYQKDKKRNVNVEIIK